MAEIEVAKCSYCGTETNVSRKYFHYPIECECHSPKHFEIRWHCKNCFPVEPEQTTITLKTIQIQAMPEQHPSSIEATKEGVEETLQKLIEYFGQQKRLQDDPMFIGSGRDAYDDAIEVCQNILKNKPQSPTASDKDGEVYRWVKASERLPEVSSPECLLIYLSGDADVGSGIKKGGYLGYDEMFYTESGCYPKKWVKWLIKHTPLKVTKQEFIKWFYDHKPYFPTPDEIYEWLCKVEPHTVQGEQVFSPAEMHEQYKKGYKDGFDAGVEDSKLDTGKNFSSY